MAELEQSNADILCLQEVPNHTDSFYQDELEQLGYTVVREKYIEEKKGEGKKVRPR